jgi:hypothetical protein
MPASIDREVSGGHVALKLSGTLDGRTALALRHALEDEGAREVVIDFSQIREFYDIGVAVLAHGIKEDGRHLLMKGLRQHQLRMFRYFGVDVDALGIGRPGPERSVAGPIDPETVAHL